MRMELCFDVNAGIGEIKVGPNKPMLVHKTFYKKILAKRMAVYFFAKTRQFF